MSETVSQRALRLILVCAGDAVFALPCLVAEVVAVTQVVSPKTQRDAASIINFARVRLEASRMA